MTTQTMRRERRFLDTRRLAEGAASGRSGAIREFFRETGTTLLGIFEAPLRYDLSPRADGALEALDETTRRDIGL